MKKVLIVLVLFFAVVFSFTACSIGPIDFDRDLSNIVRIDCNTFTLPPGGSITLTAYYDGWESGISFRWSTGATGRTITVTRPGTYSVTATKSGYHSITSDSISISLPTLENPYITGTSDILFHIGGGVINGGLGAYVGTELTAIYEGTVDVQYQWLKGGVIIPGAAASTFTPLEPGSYSVRVSAEGYQSAFSYSVTVALRMIDKEQLYGTWTSQDGAYSVAIDSSIGVFFEDEMPALYYLAVNNNGWEPSNDYKVTALWDYYTGYKISGRKTFYIDGEVIWGDPMTLYFYVQDADMQTAIIFNDFELSQYKPRTGSELILFERQP